MRWTMLTALALTAACDGGSERTPSPVPETNRSEPAEGVPVTEKAGSAGADMRPASEADVPTPSATARPIPDGAAIIRQQWAKAENRAQCAPIVFTDMMGHRGKPRAANFGGGWGVAFDLPGQRSAYGLAGAGLIPLDAQPPDAQRARLAAQWPRFRDLEGLPAPAFAGYGLEGAEAWPSSNPQGTGLHSLAYVRMAGQNCTYNVWSRVSRVHLEHLLDGLRMLRSSD